MSFGFENIPEKIFIANCLYWNMIDWNTFYLKNMNKAIYWTISQLLLDAWLTLDDFWSCRYFKLEELSIITTAEVCNHLIATSENAKNILLPVLKATKELKYFSSEKIRNKWRIWDYSLIWNVWYLDTSFKAKKEDQKVNYDCEKKILYVWEKSSNFSQSEKQRILVEHLFKNLWQWLSMVDIWYKHSEEWKQILKDIRNKLQNWHWINKFSSLETKKLFQEFVDNKVRYFIMIP